VLCQRFDVVTEDGPLSVSVGALCCEESERMFVIFHAAPAGMMEWLDPFGALAPYVEALECGD